MISNIWYCIMIYIKQCIITYERWYVLYYITYCIIYYSWTPLRLISDHTTQYIPIWTSNCDRILQIFMFFVIAIHSVLFLRCLMLQRAKICSVFGQRSVSAYCYSLFAHIVYNSDPRRGGAGSSGNPWGSGLSPAAVDVRIYTRYAILTVRQVK